MVLLETPLCNFGAQAIDFALPDTDNRLWTLEQCRGPKGLLVMFICNHCPYVKAIQSRLVRDTAELLRHGIHSVAIMANDTEDYPEDSLDIMKRNAEAHGYGFPYLLDQTQSTAKAFGAVCTPDFFGYNSQLELQYRGRLDASGRNPEPDGTYRDLFEAMKQIAEIGQGPTQQHASMGCSIKWRSP